MIDSADRWGVDSLHHLAAAANVRVNATVAVTRESTADRVGHTVFADRAPV